MRCTHKPVVLNLKVVLIYWHCSRIRFHASGFVDHLFDLMEWMNTDVFVSLCTYRLLKLSFVPVPSFPHVIYFSKF